MSDDDDDYKVTCCVCETEIESNDNGNDSNYEGLCSDCDTTESSSSEESKD